MSAVILFLSSRHPADKRRTPNLSSRERLKRASSGISGEKRRKGESKGNKEGKRRGVKRAKGERKSRKNKEAEERGRRKGETARAGVRLRMTKTGCQDPERLPDGKRQSFKQKLLSATIEFILLSRERSGDVC